jgi:hypothetical protein
MRDLKIKFGDARDNAKQSISVKINEIHEDGVDLEGMATLLDGLLKAAHQAGVPEPQGKQLAQEADTIAREAKKKKPAMDRIQGALKRMTGILTTVGALSGAVVETLAKLKTLFGIGG